MKKTLAILCSALTLVSLSSTYANTPWSDVNIDLEDLGPQEIKEDDLGPLNIQLLGDYVGKAKVECPGSHKLQFATAQADVNLVYYYDECFKEGLTIGANYMWTRLDWEFNPFFSQKDVQTASLNLGLFSQRLPNWTWRAQLSANFDNLEYWNFSDYMNYDLLLWGRYEYCRDIGVHIGVIGLTGMKIDRVYPIFGIDWKYDDNWKVNLVFPVDLSLVYTIDPCWNVAIAGRFFNQRHRMNDDGFFPEALWFYTTGGTEFAINYNPTSRIHANIHGGYNFGGHLKIANRHYHHGQRLTLDGAPYGGAEIDVNF